MNKAAVKEFEIFCGKDIKPDNWLGCKRCHTHAYNPLLKIMPENPVLRKEVKDTPAECGGFMGVRGIARAVKV